MLIRKLTKRNNKVVSQPKNAGSDNVQDMAIEKLKEAISLGELKLPELLRLLPKENSAEEQLSDNELPIGWKIVDCDS